MTRQPAKPPPNVCLRSPANDNYAYILHYPGCTIGEYLRDPWLIMTSSQYTQLSRLLPAPESEVSSLSSLGGRDDAAHIVTEHHLETNVPLLLQSLIS